ncbi:hypothetical protein BCON_0066g00010 [Botryotinia convoluta]|uniref:Nephrocystin 3-like N-terminal domain-containing protein n=1 Tax=Botryotinia convoluta TaxID=54673 RepID=A0A4Z1IKW1_9HELO|nr:hypothetical protein BCON_0066g00010 [Botryotinia convoluta]
MMSDMSSDDFEMIESEEVIKQMLVDEKPDLEEIRKWLNPTDYLASSSEFNRHASSKARNTGEWIRETSQFDQWHSSADHGSIWIKAVPGAGKSVLAASMVQSLSANESIPVLFFFFRQIIETNRTSRGLLRDWMCQLLPFSEALQLNLFEHVKNEQSMESITTAHLRKHLLTGLKILKRVYCIADALDEMNMDEEFLSQLNALRSFRPVIHVSLEEELVKRDISIFVRQRVEQFAEDGINETMQSFIQNTVCERSEGLFLYARLMLDQIAQSIKNKEHSDVSIQEMIAKLPVGLEEMYNRVLIDHASLTKIHQDIQIIILQLITQSVRPMRLIEIAKAIQDNPHLAKSGRDGKEIARSGCGPLLEVMEDGVVQILHHSFTEFLLDANRTTHKLLKVPQFPVVDPKNTHREIVLLCISQLQGGAFSSYPISDDAENGGGNGKQFRYDYEDESFYETLEDFSPGFGLGGWTQRLLENGADVEMRDSTERTSLFWAAKGGHIEVVKRLLDAGAEPDIDGYGGLKPLQVAASNNHAGVVKLLLRAGVSPLTLRTKHIGRRCEKPLSKLGQHPLMFASSDGHVEKIVEMISYCETKELEAALLRAAHHRHHALVSTILEKTDVSPNAQVLVEHADMERLRGQTVLMVAMPLNQNL